MTRKKYRYVLSGGVKLTDPVNHYRLVAGNNIKPSYWGATAIRINAEGMELEKWSCDSYSTTEDKRLLQELEPAHMIWTGTYWKQYSEEKHDELFNNILRKHSIFIGKKIDAQIKNVEAHPESYWGKACEMDACGTFFQRKESNRIYLDYTYEGTIIFPDGSKYPAASKEPIEHEDVLIVESDIKFKDYMLKVKKC